MESWIVEVVRGDLVESRHVGHGVVVEASGKIALQFGNIDRVTFPRSAIKWIQALELVISGAADKLSLSENELAIACASHNGEPEHTETVDRWLGEIKLSIDDLECGISLPFSEPVRLRLSYDHVIANQLHHCCSGKHTSMLAVCQHYGWETCGYTDYSHPLQVRIRNHLSTIFDVDADTLPHASDGCSVPTYAMPLKTIATGFARLGAEHFSEKINEAGRRLRVAQSNAPFMVAGTERLDTLLLEAGRGRLQVKMGAEGVYCGAIPDRKIGFALKCEDGSLRGQEALIIDTLRAIGEDELVARLPENFQINRVTTARGTSVGRLSVNRCNVSNSGL